VSTAARPPLGLVAATALVVGNMIGSGLFLLPSALAPYGAAAILGWAVSGAGALALAFVFAGLARARPGSGGPYAYARDAFGDGAGFVVAWTYWVAVWCANAAIAVAFAGYAGSVFPPLAASPARAALCATGAVWLCTFSNACGLRAAGRVQVATTVLKLLPLLAIVPFAWSAIDAAAWRPFDRGGHGPLQVVAATTALTLWAFLGVESATIPAGEVSNPRRNVPRATLAGSLVAIVATVAACMGVVGLLPPATLSASGAPFVDAAVRLWGRGAGTLFGATAAVACLGALNGWVLAQGQVPLAAARDGVFPAVFARVDARGTPLHGLVLGSALASALVLANYQRQLVELFTFSILLSTAATLLPYVACSAASLRQREASRASRAVAAFALLFSLGALLGTGADALLWGLVLALAGWPLHRWLARGVNPPATPG
jgi:APA family basic amino acid/polyamine antiporter